MTSAGRTTHRRRPPARRSARARRAAAIAARDRSTARQAGGSWGRSKHSSSAGLDHRARRPASPRAGVLVCAGDQGTSRAHEPVRRDVSARSPPRGPRRTRRGRLAAKATRAARRRHRARGAEHETCATPKSVLHRGHARRPALLSRSSTRLPPARRSPRARRRAWTASPSARSAWATRHHRGAAVAAHRASAAVTVGRGTGSTRGTRPQARSSVRRSPATAPLTRARRCSRSAGSSSRLVGATAEAVRLRLPSSRRPTRSPSPRWPPRVWNRGRRGPRRQSRRPSPATSSRSPNSGRASRSPPTPRRGLRRANSRSRSSRRPARCTPRWPRCESRHRATGLMDERPPGAAAAHARARLPQVLPSGLAETPRARTAAAGFRRRRARRTDRRRRLDRSRADTRLGGRRRAGDHRLIATTGALHQERSPTAPTASASRGDAFAGLP